jgi:hypothetical protein
MVVDVLSTELVTVLVLVPLLLVLLLIHPLRECPNHSPTTSFSSDSSFLAKAMIKND